MHNNIFSQLLKEPLIHFLLIGAGIFFLFAQVDSEEEITVKPKIVIDNYTVEILTNTFTEDNGKKPTPQELQILIDNEIQTEILYHEAISQGIDKDDRIIKHRLAQKMRYLFEDIELTDEPKDTFYDNLKSNYEIILNNGAIQ